MLYARIDCIETPHIVKNRIAYWLYPTALLLGFASSGVSVTVWNSTLSKHAVLMSAIRTSCPHKGR
jgi:hypothetical protein